MKNIIWLKNIQKSYQIGQQELQVLKGINLEVKTGELISIIGSSGSGKSTLLNILGILDGYDKGEYYLNDHLMTKLKDKQGAYYRNHFLGFVFQSFNLLNFKTAVENVALPLYYQKISRKKRNQVALEYLDKVGLTDWAKHYPNELSGGQKQRVAIARALIAEPKVILADEPTGALDTSTSRDIIQLFKEVNRTGVTVIIITHDPEVSQETKRIVHLKDGMIIDV